MLNHKASNKFKKDLQRVIAQGKKYAKFRVVFELLLNQQPLETKYEDHFLIGNWKGRRELHIEPDWLLIYKIEDDMLILERTGSHSELFK